MNERQKRLKEVYEHLRKFYGIHTQSDFANALRKSRNSITLALNGDEKYLTDKLFKTICEAYKGVFNLNYLLTGEGDLLTLEEEVSTNEFEKQMTQQNNLPPATDQTYFMSKVIESIETSHAQQVASMNQQIADKQTIIDLQADKIKSQADEIARLQKFIAEIRSMPTSINIEDVLKKYPFTIGVAENKESPRAQV
jgi:hypothetical protein